MSTGRTVMRRGRWELVYYKTFPVIVVPRVRRARWPVQGYIFWLRFGLWWQPS